MPKAKQKPTEEITTVEIETPKNLPPRRKALREDLQARKTALETRGWEFEFDHDTEKWTGTKSGEVGGKNFNEIETLLKFIERRLEQTSAKTQETKPNENFSAVRMISLAAISASEFHPQFLRRRRFDDENLRELADSIKNQGLINPITVRPREWRVVPGDAGSFNLYNAEAGGGTTIFCKGMTKEKVEEKAAQMSHEIVAGERRFLAARLAGLEAIPCFVKDLTDEQALEIQMQENLQRVDVHPLDEAFSYKFLMDNHRMSASDLSVKFGKPENTSICDSSSTISFPMRSS